MFFFSIMIYLWGIGRPHNSSLRILPKSIKIILNHPKCFLTPDNCKIKDTCQLNLSTSSQISNCLPPANRQKTLYNALLIQRYRTKLKANTSVKMIQTSPTYPCHSAEKKTYPSSCSGLVVLPICGKGRGC